MTQNKDLLCELENRLNVTLIERDYTPVYNMFGLGEYYLQPDIIVDERTCIVLIYGHEIDTHTSMEMLKSVISSMELKYLECYFLLTFLDLDSKW